MRTPRAEIAGHAHTLKGLRLSALWLCVCLAGQTAAAQSATVSGSVRIRGGNATPPQTKVVLVSAPAAKGRRPDRREPDEFNTNTGAFAFRDVADGEYGVVACAGTEYFPQRQNVVVKGGNPPPVTLTLRAAGEQDKREVTGVLTDRARRKKYPNSPAVAYGYECEVAKGTTNERAEYAFKVPSPPEEYTVEIRYRGQASVFAVVPLEGQTQAIDLVLDLEGAEPSLTADLATYIIENLPIDGRRWQDFAVLSSGIEPTSAGGGGVANVIVRGFSHRANTAAFDDLGPTVNDGLRLTADGYQSRRGGFFGRPELSSGGGDFHGDLRYELGHDALNARNFFNLPGFDTFREQRGLAVLSGPVVKERAWFFLGYELARRVEAPTFSTVLTSRLPALNQQLSRLGLPEENLRRFLTAGAQDAPTARLEYLPRDNHILTLRYDFRRGLLRNALHGGPGGTSDAPSAARRDSNRNHFLNLEYHLTASPTLVFDFRYNFRRELLSNDPVEPGQLSLLVPGLARTGRAPNLIEGDGRRVNNHLLSFVAQKTAGNHDLGGGAQFGFDRNVFRFAAFEAGRAVVPGLDALSAPAPAADLFQLGEGGSRVAFKVFVQNYHFGYKYSRSGLTLGFGLQNKIESPPSFHRRELNGLQPRAGLAWSVNTDTTLRVGYSMTRERLPQLPLGFELLLGGEGLRPSLPAPARRVTSFVGAQSATAAFNQFLAGQGVPAGPRLATVYDPDARSPVAQTASLSITSFRSRHLRFSFEYTFTRGSRLPAATNVNLPPPSLFNGRPDFRNAAVNPAFAQIYQFESSGGSSYHGGKLGAFASYSGLRLLAGYTLSKSIDDVPAGSFEATPQNVFDRRGERALSDFDARHALTVWADWGKNFKVIRKGRVKQEGDIFASALFNFRSGGRFNVITGFDANHDGNPLTDRPLGVGRNTFQGQSFAQLDLLVGSRLRVSEDKNIEVRVLTLNVLNRANFANFNTVLGRESLAGLDPRIVLGGGLEGYDFRRPLTPEGFGLATSAYTPRRLQIDLRFRF